METIIQVKATEIVSVQEHAIKAEKVERIPSVFWQTAEFNRYGIVPWLLVFVVGVGAATAAFANGNDWKIAVIIISTMVVESFALSLSSMKTLIIASVISVFVNLLMVFI